MIFTGTITSDAVDGQADPDPHLRGGPGVQGPGHGHPDGHHPGLRGVLRPRDRRTRALPGLRRPGAVRAHRQPLRRYAGRPGPGQPGRRSAAPGRPGAPAPSGADRPPRRADGCRWSDSSSPRPPPPSSACHWSASGRSDRAPGGHPPQPGPGRRCCSRSGRRLGHSRARVRLLLRDGLRAGAGPERRGHLHRHRQQEERLRRHPDLHVRRRPGVPRPGAGRPRPSALPPRARPADWSCRRRSVPGAGLPPGRRALGQLLRRHPGGRPTGRARPGYPPRPASAPNRGPLDRRSAGRDPRGRSGLLGIALLVARRRSGRSED